MASGEGHTEEMSSSMQGVMSENLGNVPIPSTSSGSPPEMSSARDYHLQQNRDIAAARDLAVHNMVSSSASMGVPSSVSMDGTMNSDAGYCTASIAQEQMDSDLVQDETSSHSMAELQDMDLAGKQGAYKFKNTIKLRFSADAHSPEKGSRNYQQGDSSSGSSNEDTKRKEKTQSHSPSSDSTSTNYPASDYSSNGNGSSSSSSSNCNTSNVMKQAPAEHDNGASALNSAVPGFALHPSGTYYIPIVIAVAHLLPYLRNEPQNNSMNICHPISIPISFGGPFVSMQNIHIGSGQDPGSHPSVMTKSEPGFPSGTYRR